MVNYTLDNYVGNAETRIIHIAPFVNKRYLTKKDLAPFIAKDKEEINQLLTVGITLTELCDFMEYLLEEGSKVKRGTIIDEMFQLTFNRTSLNRSRITSYSMTRCPLRSCGIVLTENRDVYFDPVDESIHPSLREENGLTHPKLRLNDISVHLARHGIFEKGEPFGDQCYPTSPLKFANDFYSPWLANKK